LVRHDARAGGEQIWLSCVRCSAKIGGALAHADHPRFASNPLGREHMGECLLPEGVNEIERARPRPLTFDELGREIFRSSRAGSAS
jgi:hypothetical protein